MTLPPDVMPVEARVREAIRALDAYTLESRVAFDKLDQNESPFDWPVEFKLAVLERAAQRPWNLYPDFEQSRLRVALAARHSLDPGEVLVGNGSNELLLATLTTIVGPGTDVVMFKPSFALYRTIVSIMGGRTHFVTLDPATGTLPIREMLAVIAKLPGTPVVIICSPNNPTGGALRDGELQSLLDTGATVLLDRAYGDFTEEYPARSSGSLVTLSTFSKAWGLAGLRVGWLSASAELVSQIRKSKLPYNLNFISEEAALLALERTEIRDEHVRQVCSERERVIDRMRTMPGVRAYPSYANFVAFQPERGAEVVFSALLEAGLLVRDISRSLPGALRVSIGDVAQNDRFLHALARIAEGGVA